MVRAGLLAALLQVVIFLVVQVVMGIETRLVVAGAVAWFMAFLIGWWSRGRHAVSERSKR